MKAHRVGRPLVVPVKPVFMRSRAHWRRWLERHHARKTRAVARLLQGAYRQAQRDLRRSRRGSAVLRLDRRAGAAHRRGVVGQRFTPRRPGSKWSKVNLRRFARLTAEGLVAEAGRGGGSDQGHASRHGVLGSARRHAARGEGGLKTSAKAWAVFQSLPPSRRKQYIAFLARPRKPKPRRGDRRGPSTCSSAGSIRWTNTRKKGVPKCRVPSAEVLRC